MKEIKTTRKGSLKARLFLALGLNKGIQASEYPEDRVEVDTHSVPDSFVNHAEMKRAALEAEAKKAYALMELEKRNKRFI